MVMTGGYYEIGLNDIFFCSNFPLQPLDAVRYLALRGEGHDCALANTNSRNRSSWTAYLANVAIRSVLKAES
jgi:hypothetical protein